MMQYSFDQIVSTVNKELASLDWNRKPLGLYAPIEYMMSLGGKRIRPALALMACNLYSKDIQKAVPVAIGIEVFHNFTLLHDDIMDHADMRRGQQTVHKKWNENTAILSGDVMQIEAYKLVAKTDKDKLAEVLNLFSQTAAEICEGQQYDIEFESRMDVHIDEYIEMIRLKTAVLLACALQAGAIVAGADDSDARHLYQFGINIGLAFQLKDDLLDVYGNEASFGKKIGGDILCNKKTYLLIQALKLAKADDATELKYWLGVSDPALAEDKIKAMTCLYSKLAVNLLCEEAMNHYYQLAIENLSSLKSTICSTNELESIAKALLYRKD